MIDSKRAATIEALLAKAETTTPEEAEALTAKAEALMIKYGIEQAALDAARKAKGGKPEEIVKRGIEFAGQYRDTLVTGAWHVAKAMSGGTVDGYRTTNRWRWKTESAKTEKISVLTLVGFESDVAQAERLIESLVLQSIVARDTWWKSRDSWWMTSWEKFVERRSFVAGFFQGAANRLREERQKAVQEARESTPGAGLALRDRKAAVADEMSSMGLRKARGGDRAWGSDGGSAGRAAGRRANVGTTGIGGSRKALA